MSGRAVRITAPLVLAALLAAGWQLAAMALGPLILPTLPAVGAALIRDAPTYAAAAGATFGAALAGLGISTAVGLVLAALAVAVPAVRAAVVPVALVVSVTPIVAIAPALFVLLGPLAFTPAPDVLLAALTALFPILINAIAGLSMVDEEAAAVFTVLSASRWEVFRRLRVPSSARSVLVGLRLGTTLAVIGAVVEELSGPAVGGLGVLIRTTANTDTAALWAAVAVSAAGTLLLIGVIALVERRIVRW